MPNDTLTPGRIRQRGLADLGADLRDLAAGRLDARGFLNGFRKVHNPVQVISTTLITEADTKRRWFRPTPISNRLARTLFGKDFVLRNERGLVLDKDHRPICTIPDDDAPFRDTRFGGRCRKVTSIRRMHNLRTTQGRDQWQRVVMGGDTIDGSTGTSTAVTATTLTDALAAFPIAAQPSGNTGLQGHVIVAKAGAGSLVYGTVMSNTATTVTIGQWNAIPYTGAVGSTPPNATDYAVMPGMNFATWIGLSTNSTAPAAGDVPRTADGLYGDGTGVGAATEQTASGLARQSVDVTYPAAGQYQFQNVWTYTGVVAVTLAKVVLFNGQAAAGNLLFLETLLSATATVSASGDTLTVTWTISL